MTNDDFKTITAFEAYHWIGQTLYCADGATVKLVDYDKDNITIEYNSKRYTRPRSILGNSLFRENPAEMTTYFPGQILYCKNGEQVRLLKIDNETIEIKYRGEIFVRDRAYLGSHIFIGNPVNKIFQHKAKEVLRNKNFNVKNASSSYSRADANKVTTKIKKPVRGSIHPIGRLMSYSKTHADLVTSNNYANYQKPDPSQKWEDDSEPKSLFSAQQMGKWPNYMDMRKRYNK